MHPMGQYALYWASRGFRVFPLMPDRPGTEGNAAACRRPRFRNWQFDATTDPAQISEWWSQDNYNIAICTTGLCVEDIDVKKGRKGLETWSKLGGQIGDTLTVQTPSGGLHCYHGPAEVANAQALTGADDGLDVRGHHGYVVAAGSTVDGVPYTVLHDLPVAPPPAAVLALCKPPGHRAENADQMLIEEDDRALLLAQRVINRWPEAAAGQQSIEAFKLACAVRDYGLSESTAGLLMDQWAARCSPPIEADDLRGRIANAYLYATKPGGSSHPGVVFSGVVIPEVPVLPAPAIMPATMLPPARSMYDFGNAVPLEDLTARPWLVFGMLERATTTTLIAPGGVGKSMMQLVVAACLAAGIDIFGKTNMLRKPVKSIIYNAEDSANEMTIRLYAVCKSLGLDFHHIAPYIALSSGVTYDKLRIVVGGRQPELNTAAVEQLMMAAADPDCHFVGLDPLNKLHLTDGNSNADMNFMYDCLSEISARCAVALMIAHHTSKGGGSGAAASMGAAAVVDSSRTVLRLSTPTDTDIEQHCMTDDDRDSLLRLDGVKSNRLGRSNAPLWLRWSSVGIPVRGQDGQPAFEEIGTLAPADMAKQREHMRDLMAGVLHDALRSAGSASIDLETGVTALQLNSSVFANLPKETIKSRMKYFLAAAHNSQYGFLSVLKEGNGAWKVRVS